ncbi:hypothetical protein PAXINDRAFT_155885 [Paxillus involutus ATCC 200175]|uniref:Crinkler effector protein N-terminal domain-containing protein n=1 Tax=Paxillus involutus ATCC 200175 TaxID=664439 RepID=A0A0C9U6J2_PAXIN|nr:hypothetical protein PAXINDRAFT_155885 [Paxillus involutus ATCC 200175]
MPTEATITLHCLVLGGGSKNVFPLKIDKTETVGALKELIKSKKPITFRDVEADTLVLWQAPESLRCSDDDAFKEKIEGLDLQDERGLHAVKRLSHIFSDPDPECLHVIVKAPGYSTPEAIITLNCLVLGGGRKNVFPVKIDKTETVGALRKLIKGEYPITFRDVEAANLVLWQAPESLRCDDNAFKETIKGLDLQDDHSLLPVKRLSQIFPQTPNPDHLHIFVQPPTSVQHRQVEDEGDIWTELNASKSSFAFFNANSLI